MKVAVGSSNPTKINAARIAFEKVFPHEVIEVVGVKVSSGIPDQPVGDTQTILGATNRAKRALQKSGADYGVGQEGGMNSFDLAQDKQKFWVETGWCAVVDKKGTVGISSSVRMEIPQKMMKHIKKGKELGEATDIEFKVIESGKNAGFFGLMTNGAIDRTNAYADGIISALTRFLHPDLF